MQNQASGYWFSPIGRIRDFIWKTLGYIQECILNRDPDQEENSLWGSFYLHPEEVDPGYYDFVFVYNDKVFATMLTRFFKTNELLDKSDSELEQLMSQSPF